MAAFGSCEQGDTMRSLLRVKDYGFVKAASLKERETQVCAIRPFNDSLHLACFLVQSPRSWSALRALELSPLFSAKTTGALFSRARNRTGRAIENDRRAIAAR